ERTRISPSAPRARAVRDQEREMDSRNRSVSRRLPWLLAAQRVDGRWDDQDLFANRFTGALSDIERTRADLPRHRVWRTQHDRQGRTELRCRPYVERMPHRPADVALFVGHLELYVEAT